MSGEYKVGDYNIFEEAAGATNNLNQNIEKQHETIDNLKALLNNESIFMGPICDSCNKGIDNMKTKINNIKISFDTMAQFLKTAAQKYKTSDEKASSNIEQSVSNANTSKQPTTSNNVNTGNANRDSIYNYLAKQGFNNAAICGILANIEPESGFNPKALGDNGTSYGICQWHNSRWQQLNNYCKKNNLDSSTVEAQTEYLVWELKNNYPSVYKKLQNVPNTQQGAYDAAYEWTVNYEVPQNKENKGITRGNTASNKYWQTYNQK